MCAAQYNYKQNYSPLMASWRRRSLSSVCDLPRGRSCACGGNATSLLLAVGLLQNPAVNRRPKPQGLRQPAYFLGAPSCAALSPQLYGHGALTPNREA